MRHHVADQLDHVGTGMVQPDEVVAAFEVEPRRRAGAEVDVEPACVEGVRVCKRLDQLREVGGNVVEDPIEQYSDAPVVAGLHEVIEVGIVAQPGVDPEVVEGVVAVAAGREDRTQRQPVAAQHDQVVEPRLDPPEPMAGPRLGRGLFGRAHHAERVDRIPDDLIGPLRCPHRNPPDPSCSPIRAAAVEATPVRPAPRPPTMAACRLWLSAWA